MADVFFYEAFEEEAALLRRYSEGKFDAACDWRAIQEAGHETPPAPIISVRTQSIIPESWAKSVKAFLTRSAGHDYLLEYKRRSGGDAQYGYLPLYCARAVAEQALTLWMALSRKLPKQIQQFDAFHRDGLTGRECEAKTLVVVGVGNIGYEIVKIGRGLNMRVIGVDIDPKHPDVTYAPIEEAIRQADILVTAMNLTRQNAGYFHYDLLKTIKPGAIFVNIARGELAVTADLGRLLDEGVLSGAGLDVYPKENELAAAARSGMVLQDPEARAVLELKKRPNVIMTPHNAFNSAEAVERKCAQSVQQIEKFLKDGAFIWPIKEA